MIVNGSEQLEHVDLRHATPVGAYRTGRLGLRFGLGIGAGVGVGVEADVGLELGVTCAHSCHAASLLSCAPAPQWLHNGSTMAPQWPYNVWATPYSTPPTAFTEHGLVRSHDVALRRLQAGTGRVGS